LHVELKEAGIHVTALLPGAVDTPMLTDFGFDLIDTPIKPMSPEQCVAEGLAALSMNRATQYGRLSADVLAKRSASAGLPPKPSNKQPTSPSNR
jgi:short-subunit dehydrogenase